MNGNYPEVKLSLRIADDNLRVDEVTNLLGCQPSLALEKDQAILHRGRRKDWYTYARTGVWSIRKECNDGKMDAAIISLLSEINSDLQVWEKINQVSQIDLFCGIFLATSNQGFSIAPATLEQLANRGIKLSLDIYGPSAGPTSRETS